MLLPSGALTLDELQAKEQPSRTYHLRAMNDEMRVLGKVDDLEATRQAVNKILWTERDGFAIYQQSGYGINVDDLIGQPYDLVASELQRRIKEALLQDERIIGVDRFVFQPTLDELHYSFQVLCASGKFVYDGEMTL